MFSKLFTLGLTALTLVGAAPATGFQSPMGISCSVNVQTAGAIGSAGAYGGIEPGRYLIFDKERKRQLRSFTDVQDYPVFASLTKEFPGHFGEWELKPTIESAFIISNVGLESPVFVSDWPKIILAGHARPAVPFAIEAAGDDYFVIKAVNEDLVWTRITPDNHSEVELRPANGRDEQKWRFVRIHEN